MAYSDEMRDAAIQAALAGAGSGALYGLGARLLGGSKAATVAQLMKAAGIGAATGGSFAGGSTLLGSSIMGPPEEEDPSAYTKRASLGGLLGGGAIGAIAGGMASRGKVKIPAKVPGFIRDYFKQLRAMPAREAVLKGSLAGAGALAIPATYYASDEGVGADFINNELKAQARRNNELIR